MQLYVNDNTSDDVQTSKLPFYKYINWEQKQEALNKQRIKIKHLYKQTIKHKQR